MFARLTSCVSLCLTHCVSLCPTHCGSLRPTHCGSLCPTHCGSLCPSRCGYTSYGNKKWQKLWTHKLHKVMDTQVAQGYGHQSCTRLWSDYGHTKVMEITSCRRLWVFMSNSLWVFMSISLWALMSNSLQHFHSLTIRGSMVGLFVGLCDQCVLCFPSKALAEPGNQETSSHQV